MDHLRFDNRFVADLPGDTSGSTERRQTPGVAWSAAAPTPVRDPHLLAYSQEVADLLGLSQDDIQSPRFARVFGGCEVLPGMAPFAACYGGHQFGHWAGQLGDGRALTLGEVLNDQGERWELQLKGAGPTPYSRTADGRAVLRSSIREFLCSEAMHHLGVPTTRALSLVGTGDAVIRDMLYDGNPRPEPGAIVCRVAPSFVRLGTFELPSSRGELDLLGTLVDFTIQRDFPDLWAGAKGHAGEALTELRGTWFREVCIRTATLMVHWMRVGFVHGVMNTDNLSILGQTLDYGPYGWLEDFDPDWTPNTTDAQGRRYRYGNQPAVAQWNLTRFAEAIRPLFTDVAPLEAGLTAFVETYNEGYTRMMAAKFGLDGLDGDPAGTRSAPWVKEGLGLLYHGEIDFTLFFRALGTLAGAGLDAETPWVRALKVDSGGEIPAALLPAFYRDDKRDEIRGALLHWLSGWTGAMREGWGQTPATQIRAHMHQVNPRYVLRNYLAQEAIDLAEQGDVSRINALLEVLRRPYDDQPEHARFAHRRPEWARHKAGCSMLSCSS